MLLHLEIIFGIKKRQWSLLKMRKDYLRPENSLKPVPGGNGYGIFKSKK